jgi:hypothetical protein
MITNAILVNFDLYLPAFMLKICLFSLSALTSEPFRLPTFYNIFRFTFFLLDYEKLNTDLTF